MIDIQEVPIADTDEINTFLRGEWTIADQEHFGRAINWEKRHLTFVARQDGELIGVIELMVQAGVMHIEDIIIKHSWRRKGVGEALIRRAEDVARELNLHKVYLETGKTWQATRFYHALGYEETGILSHHLAGHDYVEFTKLINT